MFHGIEQLIGSEAQYESEGIMKDEKEISSTNDGSCSIIASSDSHESRK